jgi:hypothetical protein
MKIERDRFQVEVQKMADLIATETDGDKPPSFDEALLAVIQRSIDADGDREQALAIVSYADEDQCIYGWHGSYTGCQHARRLTVHYLKRRPYAYDGNGVCYRHIIEHAEWVAEVSMQRILAMLIDGIPFKSSEDEWEPGCYYQDDRSVTA